MLPKDGQLKEELKALGALLDLLQAEVWRGRICFFGASNWTARRIAEANDYAAAHGTAGFVGSQPRWSLLEYPAWPEAKRLRPGALLHLNAEDAAWHARSRLPVVPYGPTGNGFFATGGAAPESFRTPANAARQQRAAALAKELDATPKQVALAWLLHQPGRPSG